MVISIINIKVCSVCFTIKNFNVTECEKIDVTEGLNVTVNGKIYRESDKVYSGTTVHFSCKENYILNDTEATTASCKQNGEWNVSIPRCIKS